MCSVVQCCAVKCRQDEMCSCWNKYPCRFIKHNIIIEVKKKKNIYIRQEIQLTNKKKHIIQLFTKRNTQYVMPDQDRCKADKHDSLFVTYTIIDPTFIRS